MASLRCLNVYGSDAFHDENVVFIIRPWIDFLRLGSAIG